MTFDQVWEKTEPVSGLYQKEEARALYNALITVPKGATVVELGPLFGKSTTVIAEVGKARKFNITCIDCFAIESSGARAAFEKNIMAKYDNVTLIEAPSHEAALSWNKQIDFIHIDADHQEHSIKQDCEDWIKWVDKNGIVAFHDYSNYMFPAVSKWADEFTQCWQEIGKAESLLIRKNV